MRIIDKLIAQWHEDKETTTKINEYIGLTLAEYDDFVNTDRVPDRLPQLAAEHKTQPSPYGDMSAVPGRRKVAYGANAPPGHLVQPGYVVPAKR